MGHSIVHCIAAKASRFAIQIRGWSRRLPRLFRGPRRPTLPPFAARLSSRTSALLAVLQCCLFHKWVSRFRMTASGNSAGRVRCSVASGCWFASRLT